MIHQLRDVHCEKEFFQIMSTYFEISPFTSLSVCFCFNLENSKSFLVIIHSSFVSIIFLLPSGATQHLQFLILLNLLTDLSKYILLVKMIAALSSTCTTSTYVRGPVMTANYFCEYYICQIWSITDNTKLNLSSKLSTKNYTTTSVDAANSIVCSVGEDGYIEVLFY